MNAMPLPIFLAAELDTEFIDLARALENPTTRARVIYQLERLIANDQIELRTNNLVRNDFIWQHQLGAISPRRAGATTAYFKLSRGTVEAQRHQIDHRGLRLRYLHLPCLGVFGGIIGSSQKSRQHQRRSGWLLPYPEQRHRFEIPIELITVQGDTNMLREHAHRWSKNPLIGVEVPVAPSEMQISTIITPVHMPGSADLGTQTDVEPELEEAYIGHQLVDDRYRMIQACWDAIEELPTHDEEQPIVENLGTTPETDDLENQRLE